MGCLGLDLTETHPSDTKAWSVIGDDDDDYDDDDDVCCNSIVLHMLYISLMCLWETRQATKKMFDRHDCHLIITACCNTNVQYVYQHNVDKL